MRSEELRRFRRGDLPAGDAAELAEHVRDCADCSAQVERDAAALTASMRAFLDIEEHPDLTAYVDGALTAEERLSVEAHLEECAVCTEDVEDLRGVRDRMRRPRRQAAWWWLAAAAAVIVALFWLWPRSDERVVRTAEVPEVKPEKPAGYGRADWDRLVADARASGAVAMPPALRELEAEPDTLRGGNAPAGTANRFTPSGAIVATAQPEMRWPAVNGVRYVVVIFHEDREVARSAPLTSTSWTPPKPLARGITYEWQVEIHRGDEVTLMPEPPDPPALFAVLDGATANAIEEARRRFPDDHFLAALLYANAGVRDGAIAELEAWLAAHPGDGRAAEVLTSIRRW